MMVSFFYNQKVSDNLKDAIITYMLGFKGEHHLNSEFQYVITMSLKKSISICEHEHLSS